MGVIKNLQRAIVRDLINAGHKVIVMHKRDDKGELAIGKTMRFPGSGDAYVIGSNGAVRRAVPKQKRR